MEKPSNSNFDRDLAAALAPGQRAFVPGFTERVLGAVHADRFRRKVIRWSSVASTLAACLTAGYFNNAADILSVNDIIFIVASDGLKASHVVSNTRDLSASPVVKGVVTLGAGTVIA